jgi:DNA replication protein DnaC
MREEIDQLCANLGLKRMRQVVARELERAAQTGCAHEEVVARLLREQWLYTQERSLAYRVEHAKIPEVWEIDTFPFSRQPGVPQAQIRQLASLDFVALGQNVVLVGDTGVGKTGLATGLLLQALRNGRRGRFIKAQDLLDEVYASLADRSTRRLLKELTAYHVLVIDELGYLTLKPEQANAFFRLMDLRYTAHRSTIITTNLPYDDWTSLLGNADMTQALLGRLRQRCVTLCIRGPSLRAPGE